MKNRTEVKMANPFRCLVAIRRSRLLILPVIVLPEKVVEVGEIWVTDVEGAGAAFAAECRTAL